jgi:hypothetical protein
LDALHPHMTALIRKLESIAPLAPEDKAALLRLPLRLKAVAADQDIVREGDTLRVLPLGRGLRLPLQHDG